MNRTLQKEKTCLHLLERAYEEFAKKGFLAAKTLDIARAAGVSHGTLFLHFPTKEELLGKTIDTFGIKLGEKLQSLKGSPRQVLKQHLDAIKEVEPFYTNLVIEGPLLPPFLRSKVFLIQSGIAHHLEKGFVKRPSSPPLYFILNSWLGLIHYYLTHRDLFAAKDSSVIDACGKNLLDHFIKTFKI